MLSFDWSLASGWALLVSSSCKPLVTALCPHHTINSAHCGVYPDRASGELASLRSRVFVPEHSLSLQCFQSPS